MRNIDFKDTESLEYLISLLVEDSNVLKEKLDKSFDDKFLDFCYWNMDDLILIKSAIQVLNRVLERAYTESSELHNTFKEFVIWHIANVDYTKQDKIENYKTQIWKEIYNISEWIEIG